MKVYVIRHGESENNRTERFTGWDDPHLTDRGREDAKKAAELLKNVRFDKIYVSDLCRAIETAETAIPGCYPERSSLLREIHVGELANKPLAALSDAQREHVFEHGYVDFGGESHEIFCNRVHQFKKGLESLDCENVAVFSHAGWLRRMLDVVLGARVSRKSVCCNNCAVAVFEYANSNWRLYSWINLS